MLFARVTTFLLLALLCLNPRFSAAQDAAQLHFIDVTHGQALLIDAGEYEVLIEIGETDNPETFFEYLAQPDLIDGALDLVIVTQTDTEGYKNLWWLLRQMRDDAQVVPFEIAQIWTLGLMPQLPKKCAFNQRNRYRGLHKDIEQHLPDALRSGIQLEHPPLFPSGQFKPVPMHDDFPGALYLINAGPADSAPRGNRCPQLRNDASMSIALDIAGTRIFVGGDASSGYDRNRGMLRNQGREEDILQAIADLDWFDDLDVLVAPRRGSWTANSPAYVERFGADVVLIGAGPEFGHPGKEVMETYLATGAKVFTTAASAQADRHHVVCTLNVGRDVACTYGAVNQGKLAWTGRNAEGEAITERKLRSALRRHRREERKGERAAFDHPLPELSVDLSGFDLFGVALPGGGLQGLNLSHADLRFADLSGADLTGANLSFAQLDYADLTGANLTGAMLQGIRAENVLAMGANLQEAQIEKSRFSRSDFSGAKFDRTLLSGVDFVQTVLAGAQFEPDNFALGGNGRAFSRVDTIDRIDHLETLRFTSSPAALQKIRKYFAETGQRDKEVDVTFAIEMSKQALAGPSIGFLKKLCCQLVTEYGRAPNRPLLLLLLGIPVFALAYLVAVLRLSGAGIYAVQAEGKGPSVVKLEEPVRIHHRSLAAPVSALYFSFVSAFHFGWRDLNIGTWAQKLSPRQFNLDATGWVRVLSGVQSMISFYLIVMWTLTFFGNPFG